MNSSHTILGKDQYFLNSMERVMNYILWYFSFFRNFFESLFVLVLWVDSGSIYQNEEDKND